MAHGPVKSREIQMQEYAKISQTSSRLLTQANLASRDTGAEDIGERIAHLADRVLLFNNEWGVYARTISAGTEVSEEGGQFTFPDSPMLEKIRQRLGVYKVPRVISH